MQREQNTFGIGPLPVTEIIREFGTPLYVYDGEKIVMQLQALQKAFTGVPLRLKYAAKALTNLSVLRLLRKAGADLDVVSIEEAQLGLLAGYAPEQIMFTPSGVSFDEIVQAVEMGIEINIDNLSMLEKLGRKYGDTVPCCIRLNPHLVAGGNSKIQVGHINSKFGISIDYLEDIHRIVGQYNIVINGLHIHTGSDIKEPEIFMQSAEILFNSALKFAHLRFISFGGGFKVAYRPDDHVTDVEGLARQLVPAFRSFCGRYGRQLEMWFEPGKFIVSEAGYLLVRANVVKRTPAVSFVGVDSGFNHLIRPMFYEAHHDIVNVSNPDGEKRRYNVVGYICETDTFAKDRELPEVREGDILAFRNAGAYGFSMSSNYNSRPRPPEVLVYGGKAHLVRKRETLEDLTRNQVVVDL
jgi:diaminopimelate decarboxylase